MSIKADLQKIFGSKNVMDDPDLLYSYFRDSNLVPSRRPAYIVMAETLPQIQDLMVMANKEHEEVWVSCKFRCEKCENKFLKNRREG